MGKVIIIGYTANSEGVVLETNIPAKLKTGNVKGKTVWVSWDKIGELLFDNYTELDGVAFRNSLRNNSSLQEEVQKHCMPDNINTKEEHEQYLKDIGYVKVYTTRILKDNKWLVIDQHENIHFQGTEIECLQWINIHSICTCHYSEKLLMNDKISRCAFCLKPHELPLL